MKPVDSCWRIASRVVVVLLVAWVLHALPVVAQTPCDSPADPCSPRRVRCEYGYELLGGRGLTAGEVQDDLDNDGCGLRVGVLQGYRDQSPREPSSRELSMPVYSNGYHYRRGQTVMGDYVGVVLDPLRGDVAATDDQPSGAAPIDLAVAAIGGLLGAALVGVAWYLKARARR